MLTSTVLQLRSPEGFRAAMDTASLSVRKLSRLSGCSIARISQLSTGRDSKSASGEVGGVTVEVATKLSAALDRDVSDLFDFPDGPALVRLGLIPVA